MDTEQFRAPPLTTGTLKAFHLKYGRTAATTDIELVHFLSDDELGRWQDETWAAEVLPEAEASLGRGATPVFGFSCYTWNVAEFLDLARRVKRALPGALIVVGGPHVQRAEDFLFDEAIDVVVAGEGEESFSELLDANDAEQFGDIVGLSFLCDGKLVETGTRPRRTELDAIPSALDIVPLRDADGEPIYTQVAYETSRGCPFRCAFCEWGTGAIGTKMYQYSLDRVRVDFEKIAAGGIRDIWLTDSNFGALREDAAKADMIIDLKRRTGLPHSFATSWSKNHNQRVQDIVRNLHRHGLLSHYHLALQTLTPLALELSHRKNMRANAYEPIVKSLAAEGIPVAAELIWGLPGDMLHEFEANLDCLMAVFPNINIFGYTLLPGTEFFDRREEYRLETIPIAGYGKAKGEYVVGCHTFDRKSGEEGYFLITSYILLCRGQLAPLVTRFLALKGRVPVSAMLRAVTRALIVEFGFPNNESEDVMQIYERRAEFYVEMIGQIERTYRTIEVTIEAWLRDHGADDLVSAVRQILMIDRARCPRTGETRVESFEFHFKADLILEALSSMDDISPEWLDASPVLASRVHHAGGVGDVMLDPDGGEWVRGRIEFAEMVASP